MKFEVKALLVDLNGIDIGQKNTVADQCFIIVQNRVLYIFDLCVLITKFQGIIAGKVITNFIFEFDQFIVKPVNLRALLVHLFQVSRLPPFFLVKE